MNFPLCKASFPISLPSMFSFPTSMLTHFSSFSGFTYFQRKFSPFLSGCNSTSLFFRGEFAFTLFPKGKFFNHPYVISSLSGKFAFTLFPKNWIPIYLFTLWANSCSPFPSFGEFAFTYLDAFMPLCCAIPPLSRRGDFAITPIGICLLVLSIMET